MFKLNKNTVVGNHQLEYFTTHITDKKIMDTIVNTIEEQGDRQNLSTNVRAQMTEWRMQDYPGFKELNNIIIQAIQTIVRNKFNLATSFICSDMWGMKYESGNMATDHDHFPSTYSITYYIKPPKKCPGLIFTDYKKEVKPENGLLVIFPSYVKHHVPSKEFEGARYVVSANYNPMEDVRKA